MVGPSLLCCSVLISVPSVSSRVSARRKHDPKRAAGTRTRFQNERAAVRFGNPTRDRQAQAGAAVSAGRVQLHEAVENAGRVTIRHALTLILHTNRDIVAVGAHRQPHDAARTGVLDGVLDNVEQHPANQILVADERHVLR